MALSVTVSAATPSAARALGPGLMRHKTYNQKDVSSVLKLVLFQVPQRPPRTLAAYPSDPHLHTEALQIRTCTLRSVAGCVFW